MPVVHLLATAAVLLLQNRQALARVIEDRLLLVSAIEEALQLDPPVQW